jgi:hypothetical protein
VLPGRAVAEQEPFFITSGGAGAAVTSAEMCELSEVSPGADCISAGTGRSLGLRAAYNERSVCHPALFGVSMSAKRLVSNSLRDLSPLFHEGVQIF